ncbi:tail sheath protein [Synechococcus phage S-SKS1]|uniref:Tail sheath protein n=1 Tax=Synechococcus phage S-SKS1 TaxID=754042 RepID=M4R1P2_9CAUD|nr:tail sheath [Synechococcus phage S-SKS1]AGH31657.1 tail sheath protein [Synechococcus phage S-SKS1]
MRGKNKMPLNLASPGIVVREVDLTVGRVDPTSGGIGAIVAPFAQGPVDLPTVIGSEKDLLDVFGKPYGTDKHYEHWLVASSYLAYGGSLSVVRADDTGLQNGFVGTAASIKIKSLEHYEELGYDENPITNVVVAARNPGSWANGLRVGIIDSKADQILTLSAAPAGFAVGMGVTQAISSTLPGAGTTSVLDGYLKGIVTQVAGVDAYVKVLEHVSAAGTVTEVDYQPSGVYAFSGSGSVAIHTSGQAASYATTSLTAQADWFDQQSLTLTSSSTVKWNQLADRPGTSEYAAARGSRFDEVHVVVVDGDGDITGNSGTVLEKHLSLSKAKDAEFSLGSPSYWRKYIANGSPNIFAGSAPAGIVTTGFVSGGTGFDPETDVSWDQNAEGITFAATGNSNNTLGGGWNYDGAGNIENDGALSSGLDGLVTGYGLFENTEKYNVDFILMGSAGYGKEEAQALANKCIAVAETRKDAVAFISPYRGAAITDTSDDRAVNINSDETITENVISFYSPITSTTYGIFDSGYKYMFDRFANTFRYVPLNGDIAGLCARNDANNFPWFSPAGTNRGGILNAVKLAYTPSKAQRDRLYSNRVNPVIFSPGAGIVLFGDKTGFGKSSAFDRINVRRLFIYLEDAISAAARDQLFEFNDEITRTNFVNIVEPFLRDVQAKRGIFDFVVICDETNNTAAIIDNNEFVADIFIKPARSINFIGLTFVATRTGVSFDEVIGNV